ncbi:hypothetical protein ACR8AL_00530 [Clavibacter sepedonicus]|nr:MULTISPECIES: hypothetical protein [Clavibacter]MBD5380316.1 hypothetical protein [Clavibacter sp.]UUK66261.1 hypothetical protein LRE50_03280 [Clavibacter sepedonicus]
MMEADKEHFKVVVVEGESDFNLLADFVLQADVDLVVEYGKDSLLEASKLAIDELPSALFVVNADFDRLTGAITNFASNVIAAEYYDLYMDAYFADPKSMTRIARRYLEGSTLGVDEGLRRAWDMALLIGGTRYTSVSKQYDLTMQNFPVHIVMHGESCEAHINSIADLAILRSKAGVATSASVASATQEATESIDHALLVNSHDFLAALSVCCSRRGDKKVAHKMDDLFELSIDRAVFTELAIVRRVREHIAA